jgi:hypothetical protein
VESSAVLLAARDASLRDGDQALDERSKLLRPRNGRREMFVAKQGRRLVPQHSDAVLRDAAKFSVSDSVSHGLVGRERRDSLEQPGVQPSCLSCPSCLSGPLLFRYSCDGAGD